MFKNLFNISKKIEKLEKKVFLLKNYCPKKKFINFFGKNLKFDANFT